MKEHTELCYKTAERFIKDVALVEYKCTALREEPDVLVFDNSGNTTLYEIKTYQGDYWNDFKKPHRIQIKLNRFNQKEIIHTYEESIGKNRYYVCPSGIINIEDLPQGWGLIWYKNNKFYLKQKSGLFKHNKGLECRLLVNALRRYKAGYTKSILLKDYYEYKE